MKYMFLIYGKESAWTEEERKSCMLESMAICDALAAQGKYLASAPLEPVANARSVRVRGAETLTTRGPFAETIEQLGGFYLIEVPNLDEAIAVAARIPPARKGTVEIRPLQPLAGLPPDHFERLWAGPPGLRPFILLCYDNEETWRNAGEAALRAAQAQAASNTHALEARGCYVSASPLHPVATATSVRVRDGKRLITDGPFAETREILGGYYVIFARDLDEAVAFAARHPGAPTGTVEVRPIFDVTQLRAPTPAPARAVSSTP